MDMKVLGYKIKQIISLLTIISIVVLINGTDFYDEPDVIIEQVPLEGNNIRAFIYNTGIFNQDLRISNTPGFEWPKDEHKFAVFTTGLSIGAYVNGQLREAMASYKGELAPGYIIDSSGYPRAKTDIRFKVYNVKRTDNWINNPDWLNWGLMVHFGAPYVDVNNNGIYEPVIDTPGVRGAEQTIFVCLTDGFPEEHHIGEGFGGGTPPLYAELHLTAWAYNIDGLKDVQFLKWEVINKNNSVWDSTYFAIVCDPDLGFSDDDYIGCDSTRNLGYCYNGDNDDAGSYYSYGVNPPAVGFDLLKSPINKSINPPVIYEMTSFGHFTSTGAGGPVCESDPNGEPEPAYQFMRGFKKDRTPWVIPNTNPPQTTKYCYSGDPETQNGWTESKGRVKNCNGSLYGETQNFNPVGDRRFVMGSGADNFSVYPGDTQYVMIAQFIARGTNHLNSVTKLKQLDDFIQAFVDNGFVIGVNPISTRIPDGFKLYQNYPNPFNPVTTIKFDIPTPLSPPEGGTQRVRLTIYDVLGKEIDVLVNEKLNTGSYSVNWDASNFASGVYYYVLSASEYYETKKMVLIK
jgi:hypothetical protein